MPLTVFPLGYTNSNYLYNMVKNHRKIIDTARQITTEKNRNIEDILTTNTNDSITTDTTKAEDHSDRLVLIGLVSLGILLILLLKWCLEKITENTSSPTERTPLLQNAAPSSTLLSPSDQSPPTDRNRLELGLAAGQGGRKETEG